MPRDILNDLIAVRTSYTRRVRERKRARESETASKQREKRDRKEEDKEKRERGREKEEKITAYPLFVGATRRINVADVAVVTGLVSLKDNT